MNLDIMFFLNSILLGFGLAMDAFSISLANGFHDLDMKKYKGLFISLIFGFFQCLMPLIGWICVHTIVEKFSVFEHFIPWIAFVLLWFIGVKMILDYKDNKEEKKDVVKKLTITTLLIQGVASSIDALSVGFTISTYNIYEALLCSCIIGIITFSLCLLGVNLGKKFGTRFASKADLIGGIILLIIGLEIFISGMINLYM